MGPPTGLAAVAWYLLLVICHLLWGLFPVSCRYLQTKADPPLESMRLGFYVAAIAAVGLFTTYTIPVEVARRCCRTEIGLEEVCLKQCTLVCRQDASVCSRAMIACWAQAPFMPAFLHVHCLANMQDCISENICVPRAARPPPEKVKGWVHAA